MQLYSDLISVSLLLLWSSSHRLSLLSYTLSGRGENARRGKILPLSDFPFTVSVVHVHVMVVNDLLFSEIITAKVIQCEGSLNKHQILWFSATCHLSRCFMFVTDCFWAFGDILHLTTYYMLVLLSLGVFSGSTTWRSIHTMSGTTECLFDRCATFDIDKIHNIISHFLAYKQKGTS